MTVYGITGPDGFLGFHTRARLLAAGNADVRLAGRAVFADAQQLDEFVSSCDHIIHVAGANRGQDDEVSSGNVDVATALVEAKRRTESRFSLAYANSVKSTDAGVYGESKREASELLGAAQADAGDQYLDLLLPHLFGECGRPFYNSAVTTFAYQLATGGQPEVRNDSELELVHAQDAAIALIAGAGSGSSQLRLDGEMISVSAALDLLRALNDCYFTGCEIPDVSDGFVLRMFNMLRSHVFPVRPTVSLTVHADARGGFYENVRAHSAGQTSISTTRPGVTRGDHFHFEKVERFIVVSGDAEIRIRRLFDDAVALFSVSGDQPTAIDMPPLHTHNIVNVGSTDLVTQFWSNDHFDPAHADTYPQLVERAPVSA